MIGAEKGYIFQDAVSSLLVLNSMNKFLTEHEDSEIVLDKKDSGFDKYDDVKIIENNTINEYQIKYKEKLGELKIGDFINKSGDFNLKQFILSFREKSNKCRIIISMNKLVLSESLDDYLEKVNDQKTFSNSQLYRFKNLNSKSSKINDNDSIKEMITENDVKRFEENVILEICDLSIDNVRNIVISKISQHFKGFTDYTSEVIYTNLENLVRDYRADSTFNRISLLEIIKTFFSRIGIYKYTSPINNQLIIDDMIYVSRESDVCKILQQLEVDNLINIVGEPGVGKSWMTKEIEIQLANNNEQYIKYYFYFNREDEQRKDRLDFNHFVSTINYDLQRNHGFKISLFSKDISQITDYVPEGIESFYFILDGFDHILREKDIDNKILIEDMVANLKELAKDKRLKVVLLSQPIEYIDINNKYVLNNFDLNQIDNIRKKYTDNFKLSSSIKSDHLKYLTNGNPLLLKYVIEKYIDDPTVINDISFSKLDDYYKYIFSGSENGVYAYIGLLEFPVSISELSELSGYNNKVVENEIKSVRNVLSINSSNEYSPFHESLKRYIISNINTIFDSSKIEEMRKTIIDWLLKHNIFSNYKSFQFLPKMIIDNNLYSEFSINQDYTLFFDSVIANGYVEKNVDEFISYCSKIFLEKKDYLNLYFISYLGDAYSNFIYEFDNETFEQYIYMKYFRGEHKHIINMLNAKVENDFSYQFREFAIRISRFLMSRSFTGVDFADFIGKFKVDNTFEDSKYYTLRNLKWNDSDDLRLLTEYVRFYKVTAEEVNNVFIDSPYIAEVLNYYIDENYTDKFIHIKNLNIIVSKNRQIPYELFLDEFEKNKNDLRESYFEKCIVDFLLLKIDDKVKIVETIDNTFMKLIFELLILMNSDASTEKNIENFFNEYLLKNINFKGLTGYYSELLARSIVFNRNKNVIIQGICILYQFVFNLYRDQHPYDGIMPFLRNLKEQIKKELIFNQVEISSKTAECFIVNTNNSESNHYNLDFCLYNHNLHFLAKDDYNIDHKEILDFMYSYGSYRDIQLWEMEDITDRLISENILDKKNIKLLCNLSLDAINRMDKAKDAWHIPNEIIRKYAKCRPVEALEILFELYIHFEGDVREARSVFCDIFESALFKKDRKIELYFRYWKYWRKTDYNNYIRIKEMKSLLRVANKNEHEYIVSEFSDYLKNNGFSDEDVKEVKMNLRGESDQRIDNSEIFDSSEIKDTSLIYTIKGLIEIEDFKHYDSKEIYKKILVILNNKETSVIEIIDSFKLVQDNYELRNLVTIINNNYKINDFESIELLVAFLVGLYYKARDIVSNMSCDDIMDIAISLDENLAINILTQFMQQDFQYNGNRKSGKIFKYLVPSEKLEDVFKLMVKLYKKRMPNLKSVSKTIDLENYNSIEIFRNFLTLSCFYDCHNPNMVEKLLLTKTLNHKTYINRKTIFVSESINHSIRSSKEYIDSLNRFMNTYNFLIYDAFLKNYGDSRKNIAEINYELKDNIPNWKIKVKKPNENIYLTEEQRNPYGIIGFSNSKYLLKYKLIFNHAYKYSIFKERNIVYRNYYIIKRSFLSRMYLKIKQFKYKDF